MPPLPASPLPSRRLGLVVAATALLAAACGASPPHPAAASSPRASLSASSSATPPTAPSTSATASTTASTTPSTLRSAAAGGSRPSGASTPPAYATRSTPASNAGASAPSPARSPAASATPGPARSASPTPVPSGTVVSSRENSTYGQILTEADGRTLYIYTPDDGQSSPQCTGSCAAVWPPLTTQGQPRAEGQAQQSLLGTEAGQVTYNGHPLYAYSGDSAPGQTNGQGSGGIWYVINTDGSPHL